MKSFYIHNITTIISDSEKQLDCYKSNCESGPGVAGTMQSNILKTVEIDTSSRWGLKNLVLCADISEETALLIRIRHKNSDFQLSLAF